MPRFFLHLHNGTGLTPDEEGVELPGLAAARRRAIAEAVGARTAGAGS